MDRGNRQTARARADSSRVAVRAIENSRKSPEIARTRDAREALAAQTGAMIGEALEAAPAVSSTNTYNYAAFDFAMGAEEINRWLAGPHRSLAEKRSAAHKLALEEALRRRVLIDTLDGRRIAPTELCGTRCT